MNGFPEDPYRRFLERANSKQNVPQRFVATATAETPEHGWWRDFRIALIATASSGNYYTILAGSDANHDGNANTDRVGTLGRETYRGDPRVNVDLRLARRIRRDNCRSHSGFVFDINSRDFGMHVLIVYAHPEPLSFNAALKNLAVEVLVEGGHEVQVSDLYSMGFHAAGGPRTSSSWKIRLGSAISASRSMPPQKTSSLPS